jgi:cobalt/nickel transport protein
MKQTKKHIIYLILIIVIGIIPLIFVKNSEFGGADGKAEEVITEINPSYKPWATSPIEPPGGETESLLFALQAAIGSGIIFYIIGYYRGKNRANR